MTKKQMIIFQIIILIISVVIHEVSHGYAAYALGDPTAKLQGRLTMNPVVHLDPLGSVLLPLMLYIVNPGLMFGWARPVPYNPYNLRGGKWGPAWVALAGPASNLLVALVFGTAIRFASELRFMTPEIVVLASIVVIINIVLALFNLIPVPPLDGSKVIFAALPYRLHYIEEWMTRYQLAFALIAIFILARYLPPFIRIAYVLLTGMNL